MTSPWSIPIFTNITIPTGAGPGDARVVIASELPPPLNTYVPSNAVPGATGFAGAFIFYSEGDDTTYTFIAVVEDAALQFGAFIAGSVVGGVMQERSANFPFGLQISTLAGFGDNVQYLTGDRTLVEGQQLLNLRSDAQTIVSDGIGESILLDNTGVTITGLNGDTTLVTNGVSRDIVLQPSGEVVVNSNIDWDGSESKNAETTNSEGTTSTAYVALATVNGTTFTAPPSGRVLVHWRSSLVSNVAGQGAFAGWELRAGGVIGAGAVVVGVGDQRSVSFFGTSAANIGSQTQVDSLTPGSVYNIQQLYRSSNAAATATFTNRGIGIVPIFN